MVQRALRITGKTRDNHETEVNNIADSVRRLFVKWGMLDDRTARSPWCLDDGLAAVATTPLSGERALIYIAAMDVWASYCNARCAREKLIEAYAGVVDAGAAFAAARSETASEAYLTSVSNVGSVIGLQGEPRTLRSMEMKTRADSFLTRLNALRAEAEHEVDALVERRQAGLAAAFYGPNGGGPKPHFAFELRAAGFTDKEIAIIRGEIRARRAGTDDADWCALLETAAKDVYLENYRTDAKLAEMQNKRRSS